MNPPIQESVFLIETTKISPNPFQPRREFDAEKLRELANSIREYGVLQPIVVTKVQEETEVGLEVRYELVAGERRYRASKLVGLERIPAIIKDIGRDRHRLELAIIENVQRANLNAIESAKAYSRLQDEFGLTQREIATRIGKSREVIANTMRLLQLPAHMQQAISEGRLGESQARLVLSLKDLSEQERIFEEITGENLSVRETRAKIQYLKAQRRKAKHVAPDPGASDLMRKLEAALGTPVKVERSGSTGKITIEFYSPEELQSIIARIDTSQREEHVAPATTQDVPAKAPVMQPRQEEAFIQKNYGSEEAYDELTEEIEEETHQEAPTQQEEAPAWKSAPASTALYESYKAQQQNTPQRMSDVTRPARDTWSPPPSRISQESQPTEEDLDRFTI